MPRPNFLIIGAAKAGTSWISRKLEQHPDVFIGDSTYFFDNPRHWANGVAWYERCFEAGTGKRAVGEKTPSYLWGSKCSEDDPNFVPARVRQGLPDARIIVILRNPVARAVSHFNYAIRTGHLSPLYNIDKVLRGTQAPTKSARILERGLYCRQLERWMNIFPRKQIRILFLERDAIARPNQTLAELCRFLDIDASFPFKDADKADNQRLSRPELILKYYAPPIQKLVHAVLKPLLDRLPKKGINPGPETIAFLQNYYADENSRLAKLLGIDLSCWCPPDSRLAKAA